MPQARIISWKDKEDNKSEQTLDKMDKWIGVKVNNDHTEVELANARFKASYLMLYGLIGFNFILTAILMYVTKGTNEVVIGLMVGTILYGLFTFIFHLNRDALMLGILALVIASDKLYMMLMSHRIGGLSIVILGFLFMVIVTSFKANSGMLVDKSHNKILKITSRLMFVLVIALAIAGLFLV